METHVTLPAPAVRAGNAPAALGGVTDTRHPRRSSFLQRPRLYVSPFDAQRQATGLSLLLTPGDELDGTLRPRAPSANALLLGRVADDGPTTSQPGPGRCVPTQRRPDRLEPIVGRGPLRDVDRRPGLQQHPEVAAVLG